MLQKSKPKKDFQWKIIPKQFDAEFFRKNKFSCSLLRCYGQDMQALPRIAILKSLHLNEATPQKLSPNFPTQNKFWNQIFQMPKKLSHHFRHLKSTVQQQQPSFAGPYSTVFCPIQGNRGFGIWNQESCVLETGIQLMESGIPLMIGIHYPSSTDKYWHQLPAIQNPDTFSFNLKNCCEPYSPHNNQPLNPNLVIFTFLYNYRLLNKARFKNITYFRKKQQIETKIHV